MLHLFRQWLVTLLLVSSAAPSCGKSTSVLTAAELPTITALRFPHEQHTATECTTCHELQSVLSGSPKRVGDATHANCNSAQCHADDFAAAPTELCSLCHEGPPTADALVPYPPVAGPRGQPAAFSHLIHLDGERMEARLGFHISCTDCHALQRDTMGGATKEELSPPNHKACARCHAAEATLAGMPSMEQCLGCHRDPEALPGSRARSLITGDLHFSHQRHRTDRAGALIYCATCHAKSVEASAEQIGQHAVPMMQSCVQCHDDSTRVPLDRRMRKCETCHRTRTTNLHSLAPRSHMPATARPANHTLAFRKDHSVDARNDSQACARCHTMMSGNPQDTCDECHQVMPPSDHVVNWREYNHGPEAATTVNRCTTCHQVDFCVACHQTRPRSHFPVMAFRMGGHGNLAALNIRACVTCHQSARDCSGPGCHQTAPQ